MADGGLYRVIDAHAHWHGGHATSAAHRMDAESDDGTIIGSDATVPQGVHASGTEHIRISNARDSAGGENGTERFPSSEETVNGVQEDVGDTSKHSLNDAPATTLSMNNQTSPVGTSTMDTMSGRDGAVRHSSAYTSPTHHSSRET